MLHSIMCSVQPSTLARRCAQPSCSSSGSLCYVGGVNGGQATLQWCEPAPQCCALALPPCCCEHGTCTGRSCIRRAWNGENRRSAVKWLRSDCGSRATRRWQQQRHTSGTVVLAAASRITQRASIAMALMENVVIYSEYGMTGSGGADPTWNLRHKPTSCATVCSRHSIA